MKHPKFVSLVVMMLVFSSVAGTCWAISAVREQNEQQPNKPVPKLAIHGQIRDSAVEYIKVNHPEVAPFIDKFDWSGGSVTPKNLLGAETHVYTSSGWIVEINYPLVANPVYIITVNYNVPAEEGSVSIPYTVQWEGRWINNGITEISYCFAQ
ncbi:MAG: hypothetical protein N3D85_05100 [Candidatus Bathyarchaeota archaeon]|nr:hypothetical protein [Candidatus Bathyarchaeota archaeon]